MAVALAGLAVLLPLTVSAEPPTTQAATEPFLIEVLFRNDTGVLFVARDVLRGQLGELRAVGFDDLGQSVAPPGVQPAVEGRAARGKELAPAAESTRACRAGLSQSLQGRWQIELWSGDLGTGIPLPGTGPVRVVYGNALWRIRRLRAQEAAELPTLRQDREVWSGQVEELSGEFLAHARELTQSDVDLAQVALVLRDEGLVREVRQRLARWDGQVAGQPPAAVAGRSVSPVPLVQALARLGSKADLAWFRVALERHPEHGAVLAGEVPVLMQRFGVQAVRPVASAVLGQQVRAAPGPYARKLLAIDREVPEPVLADDLIRQLARAFRLDPAEFEMVLAEQRLMHASDGALTAEERQHVRIAVQENRGEWIMPSAAARQEGLEKMRRWLATGSTAPATAPASDGMIP